MTHLARSAWGAGVTVDLQSFAGRDSGVPFGARSVLRDIGRKNGPIKGKLKQYDVVLDAGAGDSFTDIYGLKRLMAMVYTRRAATKLGIPVIMGPQTIGPFNTRLGRWFGRRSLRTIDAVVARDSFSAQYARTMGRAVDATSTDVVFALDVPPLERSRDVVLNISGLLWAPNRHVDYARYRQQIFELVTSLGSLGRRVSLLAHVVAPGYADNDVHAIEEFQNDYNAEIEAVIPTSLGEIRSVVANANLVIGSRMHACLNALSCGTPAIAWAYSRKFAPLMDDIGWDYVLDLRETKTSPAATTLDIITSVEKTEFDGMALAVQRRARERLQLALPVLRSVRSPIDAEAQ